MIFTISAAVGADYTMETATAQGYIGESNAELLTIALGPFAQAGFDCYCLHFDTLICGGRFCSDPVTAETEGPVYLSGTTLYCPLTERLTATGQLRVQLEGRKTENGRCTVKKSSIISLEFRPSILPAGAALGESGYDRLTALEAELASVRAQITALEQEGSAQTAEELSALSARLRVLETAAQALSDAVDALNAQGQQPAYTLPAASADTLGGVKVAETNAVRTDANGRLTVNECRLDWKLTTALMILSMLDFNDRLWALINDGTRSESELQTVFTNYNMDVIDGNREALLFVSSQECRLNCLDENYDSSSKLFVKGNLYMLYLNDGALTIESLAGESLRQLLLRGI